MGELPDKVNKISNYLLVTVENHTPKIGLNYGKIGVSIFLLTYYLHTKDKKFLNIVQTLLEDISDKVSEPQINNLSHQDLIDYAKYLQLLEELNFVDFNINKILSEFDTIFDSFYDFFSKTGNIDVNGGILDIGNYYLTRLSSVGEVVLRIERIILGLKKTSLSNNSQEVYWKSHLYDGTRTYLGLHGSASVIVYLSKVFEKGILVNECKNLISKSTRFLLNQKLSNNSNKFPEVAGVPLDSYSLEYAYSDLYIGYSLYLAGQVLEDQNLIEESNSVFQNSFQYLLSDDSIRDVVRGSGIAYGIEGTFTIYQRMHDLVGTMDFFDAKKRCIEYSSQHLDLKDDLEYLGYDPKIVSHTPESHIGFINGLAGIGSLYISYCDPSIRFYERFLHF